MNTTIENHIGKFLANWTRLVCKNPWWVVLGFSIAAVTSLYYAITHLGINTDTKDMLDETLPYRQTLKSFHQQFPQLNKPLIVVIDGDDSGLIKKSSAALAQRLRENSGIFTTVYQPGTNHFFTQNGLLYLPMENVESLSRRLVEAKPILIQLQQKNNTSGLLKLVQQVSTAKAQGVTSFDLSPILTELNLAISAQLKDKSAPISWQELLLHDAQINSNNQALILVQARTDFSKFSSASSALKTIRKLASELKIDAQHGLRVRITGNAALADDEMKSVSKGMELSGSLAFVAVVVLLWFGTGSFRILLFSITCLLIGLSLTAGFAALAVGSLNLISVAFALLYIGLGIDFSIHLCLRYEELLSHTQNNLDALSKTSKDVGVSLVICALSTAIGFYAFVPTNFVGVSELGIISGTGMFISLLVSMSVLPALFSLSPMKKPAKFGLRSQAVQQLLSTIAEKNKNKVILISVLLAVVATWYALQVRFDYDLLNMRNPDSESVQAFRDLMADSDSSPWRLTVLADSRQQALAYRSQLLALPSVEKVVTEFDLVPNQQAEKLAQINQAALQLSELLNRQSSIPTQTTTAEEIDQHILRITEMRDSPVPWQGQLQLLLGALKQFSLSLKNQTETQKALSLAGLDQSVMGSFATAIGQIKSRFDVSQIRFDSLPDEIVHRWISKTDTHRLLVFAKHNLSEPEQLRQFVGQVSQISSQVTDLPAIHLAAGEAAVGAFQQAFISAILLISALLMLLLRNIIHALIVMAPLLLAGVFTACASLIFDIPFNFANIIALPLLLGIGVDSGIHMVSRARTQNTDFKNLMQTSTPRAVILSALTTVASFGNLGLSGHPGTASMGQLLTIGVLLTMVCTLLILPSLLPRKT